MSMYNVVIRLRMCNVLVHLCPLSSVHTVHIESVQRSDRTDPSGSLGKDTAAGGVHSISIFALLKNIQKKLFNKNIAISGKNTATATATISILQLRACSLEKPIKLKHTLMETSPGKDTATILITNPNQIQPHIVNILIY